MALIAINAIYRDADPVDKNWQRAAFVLFFINLPAIWVAQNLANQAWDACGVGDSACIDAVLSTGDAANGWMFAAGAVGVVAFALPPHRNLRVWRIVLMAGECVAMLAQMLVYA
ncbi:hypothetical protein P8605_04690 [Streptomyces sp. T-3]|nr:hypothetical protein [Streptomyces sp. T-3]